MSARQTLLTLVIAGLGILTTGCSTANLSPREAFLRANPGIRSKFLKLRETSVEELELAETFTWWPQILIAERLRADFATNAELVKRLDQLEAHAKKTWESKKECFAQMSSDINTQTDTLFFYSRHEGRGTEEGWMLVRRGRILKKYVLATREYLDVEEP
ncbi:MAG: hypothetical protein JNN07_14395 [Verrucomicrobiales bacterium]|nr:hypothetical protein [Verrucomicrobiales bacterium]